mmetsp:Transcript_411/g.432  ORF Transcript_411/g.432 Transcript_411/m.432 type:complete len:1353 (+) Transcript_411:82-4140(+)
MPSTSRSRTSSRAPKRFVHTIASGIKKSTKLFGKRSKRSRNANYGSIGHMQSERSRGDEYVGYASADRETMNAPFISRPRSAHSDIGGTPDDLNFRLSENSLQTENDQISVEDDQNAQVKVLNNLEYVLRSVLIYLGVYLLGVNQPISFLSSEIILKIGYHLFIVWVTCVFIKLIAHFLSVKERESRELVYDELIYVDDDEVVDVDEDEERRFVDGIIGHQSMKTSQPGSPISELHTYDNIESQRDSKKPYLSPMLKNGDSFKSRKANSEGRSPDPIEHNYSLHSTESAKKPTVKWSHVNKIKSKTPQHHPELEDLFLINKVTGERIAPNGDPTPLENDMFKGDILFMFRTSDADEKEEPRTTRGSASSKVVSNYLRPKKRRFEIQLQFKMKKIPDSPIFLVCDIEEPFKLGLVQRAFVKATLNYVKKKNPSFSYSLSGYNKSNEEEIERGNYENPHMSFPLEQSLDVLIATKPGEELPRLGTGIHEDPEAIDRRKKNGFFEYNLEDTYTACIWSSYVDFLTWKAVNLPAIRPFSIARVNGSQPTDLRIYSLKSSTRHLQSNLDLLIDFEIANRKVTNIGNSTKKWIEKSSKENYLVSTESDIGVSDEEDEGVASIYGDDENVGDVDDFSGDSSNSDLESLCDIGDDVELKGDISFPLDELKEFTIDVPVWAEIMHRTKRKLQRVYVLRIAKNVKSTETSDEKGGDVKAGLANSFIRLRTGKQLSALLRLGVELNSSSDSAYETLNYIEDQVSPMAEGIIKAEDSSVNDDYEYLNSFSNDDENGSIKSSKKTGKSMPQGIKHHVKRKHKRQLRREIPIEKRRGKRSLDHHVAVNKVLKRTIRRKSPLRQKLKQGAFEHSEMAIAGELAPTDQSCRTLSHFFATLSKAFNSSRRVQECLSSQISSTSDFDSKFLQGDPAELGVNVSTKSEKLRGEFVAARCLWESFWREEACLIYDDRIEFFAPSSKRASFTAFLFDVRQIRTIDFADQMINPLGSYPILAIETAWKCHYLAFVDESTRNNFRNLLNNVIFSLSDDLKQKDEWQAHFWQGFQHSAGSGKWAKIVSSKKSHLRLLLNRRRMPFDCERFQWDGSTNSERKIGQFVEDLLKTALSFSMETLENSPASFLRFQDKASRLQNLPIQKLIHSGKEALCICVNLYHCLLQHSLLLSLSGPTKKSVVTFMCTHCYEIGGDVFSLAELECCVIRGNLSNGIYIKAPFVRPPKKSKAHYAYALDTVDPRINFLINTCDTSKSQKVPILSPSKMEEQFTAMSSLFLRKNCSIDVNKRVVSLPKICEVYRNDFGDGDSLALLHYCLQYMEEKDQATLTELIRCESGSLSIKFEHSPDSFYSILKV